MKKHYTGVIALFLAAFIWGSSFIVMKSTTEWLTPAVLLTARFSLAALLLFLVFFKKISSFPKDRIGSALKTGVCLFFAYYIQTWGLMYTTPGKNAFLTAAYCVIVPFLVWGLYQKKPTFYQMIAALLCLIGVGFVSLDSSLTLNKGDLLTLIASFFYALHMIMIKKNIDFVHIGIFTMWQFVSVGLCAFVAALLFEDITLFTQMNTESFIRILYLVVFSTVLTICFQSFGQKYVTEAQASIILSFEAVFGVIFSVLFYGEILSVYDILGFVLIFDSLIISEKKTES